MTDYMTQQALSLPPSSRQDIVSALLSDYGSSFDDGNSSPYKLSPVPAFKELPPPPPPPEKARARNYRNDRSSPAFQKMNTPFQLRVDVPASPDSTNWSSTSDGSPSRILSRSLKRRSIPRSLTLTVSNGSTAQLPSARTPASESEMQNPFLTPAEEKALPPPPPEKSSRRQQPTSSDQKIVRSPRKDSLHSQDGKDDMEPVRRKPLPKFTSLADLGNGPRGGKGGPLPQARTPKQNVENDRDIEGRGRSVVRGDVVEPMPRESAPPKLRERAAPTSTPRVANLLPPTPQDEPVITTPVSSRTPFGGMGLPSNPKHRKGKSDTGFDALRSATSPRVHQLPAPQTITPGPTPTPRRTESMEDGSEVEQTGLGPEASNNERRPFSFERVSTSPHLKEATREPSLKDASTNALPPFSSPSAAKASPTIDEAQLPPVHPPRSASRQPPSPLPPPPAFASLPSQQRSSNEGMSEEADLPPFVPLTEAPMPAPGPPITHQHHGCYSQHATFVWSRNDFQPMGCMICAKNDSERRWACVWCYLRICVDCSVELQKTPGRRLQAVLDKRAAEAAYAGDAYREEGDVEEAVHAEPAPMVNGDAKVNVNVNGKRHDSGGPNPSFVVWDADAEDVGEGVDFS